MSDEQMLIEEVEPGILVIENIHRQGGIRYDRKSLTSYLDGAKRIREWETKSIIDDEEEFAERNRIIQNSYSKLRRFCTSTSIGLICKMEDNQKLHDTVKEIYEEVNEFNENSSFCKIHANYHFAQLKGDDASAVSSITEKISQVATQVEEALNASDLKALRDAPKRFLNGHTPEEVIHLDTKTKEAIIARCRAELIRGAVTETKGLEEFLPKLARKELMDTADQARGIARKLCHRVERKHESLEDVMNQSQLTGISMIRNKYAESAKKASIKALSAIKQTQDAAVEDTNPITPRSKEMTRRILALRQQLKEDNGEE